MKLLPYAIVVVFLALIAFTVIYLSKKIIYIFGIESTRLVYITFSLLPLIFMVVSGVFTNATGMIGHILYKTASVTMGIYLFVLLSFLVADGIGIFVKLKPSTFGLIGFGLAFCITLFGYWRGASIQITPMTIPMEGLTKKVKAVHLTDIHIGHFRTNGFLQEIIEKTNAQNPDVVLITGDYLDSEYALKEKYFEPLKQIKAPVYFVDGNHDHATNMDSIYSLMKKVGVHVLENEKATFGELQIAGLTHMLADRNSFDMHASDEKPTMDEVLPTLKMIKERPTILLHHAPNGIKYANEHGIDLYLTGHTHAGQIFPFNFVANMIFDYNRGLHDYNGTKILVSEGIGTFGPPFRLGTKSEIIALDLIPKH
ncbi:metallophosphoesterase [Flammeovirga sp. OC4]|uniref:metallophosphoesterase n=1 Tax=Flammeovirga sp. OC4 TaxID=1382345 RepID=UPI0005C58C06|nr:metallophosphoesterase [Flammeovirga sp. OC4]